jgi:hypothetical protein
VFEGGREGESVRACVCLCMRECERDSMCVCVCARANVRAGLEYGWTLVCSLRVFSATMFK